MKNSFIRLFLVILIAAGFALLLPYLVAQANPPEQGGPPQIPHAKEGRTDCLSCHEKGVNGAPKFPPDHAGRTNEMCVVCHQFKPGAANATPAPTTAAGTTAGVAPAIPHTLEGRDQCLSCHQTGVGGAPKVPASHAGRTNDQCKTCHQPKVVAPVIVPTRVPHAPAAANQNTCVECHTSQGGKSADIVKQHAASIHAARGVQCVDCHGGDPTKKTKEEAMSKTAGFVGSPKPQDIPGLCASCHARVDLMRQYDIPTDQYAQYQSSVHGTKLAQGDVNVATCFVCHDGHGTKEVKDPTSNVYPMNVPGLCGSCHANAQLMKPYNIPTNQYDLYKKSVHGIALLQKQDPRAPSCATCHGTHGAAPPGYTEVANVCGSCHSATQDYYLKSIHASNAPGTPKCVTCHGRYDVGPASEAMFSGDGTRDCGSCHTPTSPQATGVKQIADAITASAKAVDDASAAIKRAAGTGLIVAPEEAKLADAKTNLITARAAQHTLSMDTVKAKTDKAVQSAKEIQADAEKSIDDSVLRRQAMVIGIAVALLAIASLYVIRRELYRQLPPKE
jgi:hypothetical protein